MLQLCRPLRAIGRWGTGTIGEPRNTGSMNTSATAGSAARVPHGAPSLDDLGASDEPDAVSSLIGLFDPAAEGTCRVCGCWDYDACVDADRGPCGWAAPNLCDSHRARDLLWALWQLFTRRLRQRR